MFDGLCVVVFSTLEGNTCSQSVFYLRSMDSLKSDNRAYFLEYLWQRRNVIVKK